MLGQQAAGPLLEQGQQRCAEGHAHRLLQQAAFVGQADPISREHSRQWMQQHLAHPQQVGQGAGMLPTGATKAAEHRLAQIMAALNRNAADRLSHSLQRHR